MSAMSTNHQAALFESGASQPRRIWALRGAFHLSRFSRGKLAAYAYITCERKQSLAGALSPMIQFRLFDRDKATARNSRVSSG